MAAVWGEDTLDLDALAVRNMGGESEAAWREVLDDLVARGLKTPELVIIDGGKGLEAALVERGAGSTLHRPQGAGISWPTRPNG